MKVRPAQRKDAAQLLPLMRALAEFEHYIDVFAITEELVCRHGFDKQSPDFHAFVAETGEGELVGMVVYYFIPYTASARPTLFVKELYVAEAFRSAGVGRLLMKAAALEAVSRGCGLIKWQVANWNHDGIRFYERLGARPNHEWLEYVLDQKAFGALAEDASV